MAERMKELAESIMSLGDIVTRLSAARDAALNGDRGFMRGWLEQAETQFKAYRKDCEVICTEAEGEK
jgi:hypothetical protein